LYWRLQLYISFVFEADCFDFRAQRCSDRCSMEEQVSNCVSQNRLIL